MVKISLYHFAAIIFTAFALNNAFAEEQVKDNKTEKSSNEDFSGLNLMYQTPVKDSRLEVANIHPEKLHTMTLASAEKGNGWNVKPIVSSDGKNLGAQLAFRYTGGGLKEFFWGVTRPVHLYNHNRKGKVEILPFYSHPIKAGGALSPLNPHAWKLNPSLTAGAFAADIAFAATIYALNHNGESSDSYNPIEDGIIVGKSSSGDTIYQNPETGEFTDSTGNKGFTIIGGGHTYVPKTGGGTGPDTGTIDPSLSSGHGDSGSDGNSGGDDSGGSGGDPDGPV